MRLLCLRLPLPPLRPNPTTKSFFSLSSCWSRATSTRTRTSPTNHHKQMSPSSSSAAAVAEGSAARRFWIAASSREAAFATYTPFLLSLAAGSLRLDSFRHYLVQDTHFLHAFARAYEMAEECADDDDDKATITALRKAVLRELNLHSSVLQEWGVDPTKEILQTQQQPSTLISYLQLQLEKLMVGKVLIKWSHHSILLLERRREKPQPAVMPMQTYVGEPYRGGDGWRLMEGEELKGGERENKVNAERHRRHPQAVKGGGVEAAAVNKHTEEAVKIAKATWMADGTHWPGTWIQPSAEHMKGDHAGIIQFSSSESFQPDDSCCTGELLWEIEMLRLSARSCVSRRRPSALGCPTHLS